LDQSDGLKKLCIPSKHRRNQDQHQFSSMQYAEHERAPIPVLRVRILSRNINSRSWLLLVPKNGPRYVCQKMQRTSLNKCGSHSGNPMKM